MPNCLVKDKQHAFMTSIINDDVTHSYKEAVKFEVRCEAIGAEVDAFEIADTWDITTCRHNISTTKARLVITLNKNDDTDKAKE